MKKSVLYFLLLLAGFLFPISSSFAQAPAEGLESLQASFWPDFDRASVLVLLTGELPAATVLPAEVSFPVPSNAEINAVAQIDENGMVSIDYEANDDTITFVTTNPRFRVEYYIPYEQDGRLRSYDFDWQSTLSVADFAADIQQPANATGLASEPGAQDVFTSQTDGLVYHSFDSRAVPAGTPYRLSFNYELASDGLTVDPAASVPESGGQVPSTSSAASDTNWVLIAGFLGLLALGIVGTWLIATRSSGKKSSRPRKPSPKNKKSKTGATIYCHVCGQPAESDDRFCRQCGSELKRL